MTAVSDAVDAFVGKMVDAARDNAPALVDAAQSEIQGQVTDLTTQLAAANNELLGLRTQAEQDAALLTADQETIAGLQTQHAADQATIGQQSARITQLEAELADDGGMIIGARLKDVPFTTGNAQLGPLKGTRVFYDANDALPVTWTPPQDWPADTLFIVSYKLENQPHLGTFAQSLHAQGGLLAWHHEPEADFPSGAAFLKAWHAQQAAVKAAAPSLPFGMIAGAYQYRTAGTGYDGSYIPADADWYSIDTYLQGADSGVNKLQPLETEPRFQRWLSLVPADKPKYVTEYGRGLTDTSQWDAQRAQLIPADQAYLQSIGIRGWFYWYTNTGVGNWRFSDAASQAAWRAVAGG